MYDFPIKIRDFILIIFFSITIIVGLFYFSYFDYKTKVVFCDVGQGDGAYIRIHNRFDVLVDAGPDRKILSCLGKYMPFYDKTIELVILSHDQKDHFGGLDYLIDRYRIIKVLMPNVETSLDSFIRLKQKMIEKKIGVQTISSGKNIKIMNSYISFYWPNKDCISSNDNDCSAIFNFKEDNFIAMFTGDATPKVLNEIATSFASLSPRNDIKITILKIPHHGSKNGLTERFLSETNPNIAVISVGKKNVYGHPSKEILDMLRSHKVKIRRTDEEGDIMFKITNNK